MSVASLLANKWAWLVAGLIVGYKLGMHEAKKAA